MKVFKKIIVIILLISISFCGGYLYCLNQSEMDSDIVKNNEKNDLKLPGEKEKRIVTINEIEAKLIEIGELSTYSGEYTVTKEADYSRYFIDDFKIPGTKNTVHIECKGIVKVGYNISDINVDVNNDIKKIYIGLPEPMVNDNYVIWDSVKCSEKNNVLNPIDFAQYQVLINEIETEGLKKAENKGIYNKAEDNFKNIIVNFLSGFENYEVVFM